MKMMTLILPATQREVHLLLLGIITQHSEDRLLLMYLITPQVAAGPALGHRLDLNIQQARQELEQEQDSEIQSDIARQQEQQPQLHLHQDLQTDSDRELSVIPGLPTTEILFSRPTRGTILVTDLAAPPQQETTCSPGAKLLIMTTTIIMITKIQTFNLPKMGFLISSQ